MSNDGSGRVVKPQHPTMRLLRAVQADGLGMRVADKRSHRPEGGAVIRFGRFSAVPGARQLLADGRPVALGGRAFDLLMVLLKSRGNVVAKEIIVDHVWPSTAVEESNLRFQIAALRKALGPDRDMIKTVSGRGYILAGDVEEPSHDLGTSRPPKPVRPRERSPAARPNRAESGVVVIEDDRDLRESLKSFLESTGLPTEAYGSVEAFRDSARPFPPGCLVLDVWLPGQTGLDFQAELADQNVDLPIIFISGHADVPMCVRAMKAGAIEFLTKPVHHEVLLSAIHFAVGRGGAPRESVVFDGRA